MIKFITIAVLLTSFYFAIVPSDSSSLPSLVNSSSSDYPEIWKESGFVELSHGMTKYYMIGPGDGRKVLFVHGMGLSSLTIGKYVYFNYR
jgi:hypothetical protein